MWSRKSAMLGSLAVAMYLLGLTLRNSQLVTIAVVIFVFACRVDWALGRIYNARHGKATYNAFAACQIDKPEYTPADTGMLLAFTVVVIVASRFC